MRHNYTTSKDYGKLFGLVHKYRIVCFVSYKNKEYTRYDVCQSQLRKPEETIMIGARGISYIDAMKFKGLSLKEDFIKQCEECGLEFIEPNN